jgi:predicted DNA binding CopG/RHH family protein
MQNTKAKAEAVTRSVSLPTKVYSEITKRASKAGLGFSAYIRMLIIREMEKTNG